MPARPAAGERTIEILSPLRSVDFEDAWYDAADANHFWMEWRFRELMRLFTRCGIRLDADARVLEVGGGHGVARTQLEAVTRWQIDLTDLNVASLERCGTSRGRTLYYDVNDRVAPLRERYDTVLLLDVLEHIEHPQPFLESVAWHLKPGGLLVINVPALPLFYSAYDLVLGHCRRYTRTALRAQCAGAGLSCEVVRFWGFTLLPLLAARFLVMRRLSGRPGERSDIARKGMAPPNRIMTWILRLLMRSELWIPFAAALGTSLLCAARKRSS